MNEESGKRHEERHLAAIVFTDVAGYSARMQRDEAGTLAAVRADFDRMKKLCRQYRGEVLNTMGDGMLLCFSSAVKAVAWSLQLQSEFAKRNPTGAEDGPLEHRIGIHVGDIFRHEGQVAGDGVNIAARLQTKAPPGGICISQIAYDMVSGKMPLTAEPLGLQEFKNISKINVYCLSVSAASAARARAIARRYPAKIVAAAAVLAATAVAIILWLRGFSGAPEKSIAVLPFANLSPAAENAFFADGVHEDLIASLARIGDLTVISRTSVLAYRETGARNLRAIAADLDVAHILEGTVRRDGTRVRITAKLIDARTDRLLWNETFDREVDNVFEVQAEIAQEIAKRLEAGFAAGDHAAIARRPTADPVAYDLYIKARSAGDSLSGAGRDAYERVAGLYEQAVARDPNFVLAWVQLSTLHGVMYWYGSLDPSPERRARARQALDAAVRLAPDLPETRLAKGNFAYRCENDWAAALREYQAALASRPNDAQLMTSIGAAQRRLGQWPEALRSFENAVRLNPQDFASIDTCLNTAMWMRRYSFVTDRAREYLKRFPNHPVLARYLAEAEYNVDGRAEVLGTRLRAVGGTGRDALAAYQAALAAGELAAAERTLLDSSLAVIPDAGGSVGEPAALHRAQLAFARRDAEAARRAGEEAAGFYRSQRWTPRQEPVALAGQARAVALAGRGAEAVRMAREALQRAAARDAIDASFVKADLSRVLVIAGERDEAFAVLAELLEAPFPVGAHALRLDPVWSTLTDDPRFSRILATAKAL